MCWDRFVKHQVGLDSQHDSQYVQCVQLIRTAIGPPRSGQLGGGGGVGGDVPGAAGGIQRRPQCRLDADQCRGGHRPTHGFMLPGDRGKHRLHMRW
jgi:hypothetical protein